MLICRNAEGVHGKGWEPHGWVLRKLCSSAVLDSLWRMVYCLVLKILTFTKLNNPCLLQCSLSDNSTPSNERACWLTRPYLLQRLDCFRRYHCCVWLHPFRDSLCWVDEARGSVASSTTGFLAFKILTFLSQLFPICTFRQLSGS